MGDVFVVVGVFCGVWSGFVGNELEEGEVICGRSEEVEGGVMLLNQVLDCI